MFSVELSFELPAPWQHTSFSLDSVGPINFLVGPNGSGKSRFAAVLHNALNTLGEGNRARLLGTDRLSAMAAPSIHQQVLGSPLNSGYSKGSFPVYKSAGRRGSGLDAMVLLEERLDLRLRLEATLSSLFDREIILEWDAGNLIPRGRHRTRGTSYRLDQDECHGIKEILVLLTRLYDDDYDYLIIDEPELNLHPQYQSFIMQEIRKLAGNPAGGTGKRCIFLITHSPFILDFKSEDDLRSVISFDLAYSNPVQVEKARAYREQDLRFVRRMNAHGKQMFFATSPVFVEGILDAQLVEGLMDAANLSLFGAGSCIIEAGGSGEVTKYLMLCRALGKDAHFLYDLDSLFRGTLKRSVSDDEAILGFLATAGMGLEFGGYFGLFERDITEAIKTLENAELPDAIVPLGRYLKKLGVRANWTSDDWAKARVAALTALSRHRLALTEVLGDKVVEALEGRRSQIVKALEELGVHVLAGGTLERYLPHFSGDEYELGDSAKNAALTAELSELGRVWDSDELQRRYGELYEIVKKLPSVAEVDVEGYVRKYLGSYIFRLQQGFSSRGWRSLEEVKDGMMMEDAALASVFKVMRFDVHGDKRFTARIEVNKALLGDKAYVEISEGTNAGMGEFVVGSVS